jgi:hypothetical protein
VHQRHQVSERLLQLASLQAHVVTREQAVGHGMSRHSISRLVESGSWRRLARGLFLTGPIEPSWDSLAWGGLLLGGQSARLGPEASGYLHQLLSQAPNPLDVLLPHERRIEVPVHGASSVKERVYVRLAQSRTLRDSLLKARCSIWPRSATLARWWRLSPPLCSDA